MKRERAYYHHLQPQPSDTSAGSIDTSGKLKMWPVEEEQGNGMDELLAVLGYKVRSSDMAEVAQKLEQLEEVMGNVQEDGLSHLASDTVHYNPADLSTWLETMLSELNPLPNHFDPFFSPLPKSPPLAQTQTLLYQESSSSEYDLKAIPGKAVLESPSSQNIDNSTGKRPRPSFNDSNPLPGIPGEPSTRHVVLVDSQENGVRLVHALMACAEAAQQNKLHLAEALVKQVGYLALSQAGAMRKVATYFAEALGRRIYRVQPQSILDNTLNEMLQMHFYETCPYLKFAHFTANQAILEAFVGKTQVHVIDFSMNRGLQWPALMQALALRPGGPPSFRLTGIGPPSPDNSDRLQEVGWNLAQLAGTIKVKFEYRGFVVTSMADLEASMFMLRPSEGECVAVNSIFELHKLLAPPGAFDKVLSVVKQVNPVIVTIVEQEANHNGPVFMDRFTESLHYYSTLFDSLEGSVDSEDKAMSEVYLGKQICNLVACEGLDRVERHETLAQWRNRLGSAGFAPVHLGSNAFKQASMLLALFAGGDGYRVEENDGCLMLGWHTRPLIATSAWRLGLDGN